MNRYKFIVSLFILQRLLSTHSMLGTKVGAGIRYSNCIQEVSRLSEIQFFSYVLCFICYRVMHRELLELKSFLLMSWNDWMNNKNKTDIIRYNILFLKLGAVYYSLWKFTELYIYDLCTFLYCYIFAKSFKNLLYSYAIKFIFLAFISTQIISVIIEIFLT